MTKKLRSSKQKMFLFFVITYLVLWLGGFLVSLLLDVVNLGFFSIILRNIPSFSPLISSIFILKRYHSKEEFTDYMNSLFNFNVNKKWYIISLAIPIFTYSLLRFIQIFLGNEKSFFEIGFFDLGLTLVFAILLSGIKEEPGWRGYAVPQLMKKYSAIGTSLIIGLIWAFWHVQFYIFGARPIEQFPQFVLTLIALSIIYTWLFIQTDSIPVVVTFHIVHNFSVFTLLDLNRPITFWNGGGLVYSVIAIFLIYLYGPELNKSSNTSNMTLDSEK